MDRKLLLKSMVASSKVIRKMTNADIAKACGITPQSLYLRINDPDSMRVGELRKLIELLGWSDESVMHLLTYQDDGELG